MLLFKQRLYLFFDKAFLDLFSVHIPLLTDNGSGPPGTVPLCIGLAVRRAGERSGRCCRHTLSLHSLFIRLVTAFAVSSRLLFG